MKGLTLSRTAKMLGVHRDTIIYWENQGYIPTPRRNPKNNYRIYTEDDILEIIRLRDLKVDISF